MHLDRCKDVLPCGSANRGTAHGVGAVAAGRQHAVDEGQTAWYDAAVHVPADSHTVVKHHTMLSPPTLPDDDDYDYDHASSFAAPICTASHGECLARSRLTVCKNSAVDAVQRRQHDLSGDMAENLHDGMLLDLLAADCAADRGLQPDPVPIDPCVTRGSYLFLLDLRVKHVRKAELQDLPLVVDVPV